MSPSLEVVVVLILASIALAPGQAESNNFFKSFLKSKFFGKSVSKQAGKNDILGNHFNPKPLYQKKFGKNEIGTWVNPKPIDPKKFGYKPSKNEVGYAIDISPPKYVDTTLAPQPTTNETVPHQSSGVAVGATPCQTAEQWEGRGSEWDHILDINNRFNISFDGINRRKRIIEVKHAQLPGKRTYEYIMLYNEGIQYVINHNYNTCTIENLGTWRNFSIPPNSILEDTYEIGAPEHAFMVQEWSDRIPGRQRESWIGTFSFPGCWPMTDILMEKDEANATVKSVTTKFFDLHEGIKNSSVFTPPAFCKKTPRPNKDIEVLQERPILDLVFNEDMSGDGSGDDLSGDGAVQWIGLDMLAQAGEGSGEGSGDIREGSGDV